MPDHDARPGPHQLDQVGDMVGEGPGEPRRASRPVVAAAVVGDDGQIAQSSCHAGEAGAAVERAVDEHHHGHVGVGARAVVFDDVEPRRAFDEVRAVMVHAVQLVVDGRAHGAEGYRHRQPLPKAAAGTQVGSEGMSADKVAVTRPPAGGAFGPNAWLVDDMYEQYRDDPSSVSESWREFFADYVPPGGPSPVPAVAPAPAGNGARRARPPPPGRRPRARRRVPLRCRCGAPPPASPPTWRPRSGSPRRRACAPSRRSCCEVNRAIINQHLARTIGGKVELHPPDRLRGGARPRGPCPALNASFVADSDGKGTPGVVRHDHVGLGLAVDVAKADGTRTLLVPVHARGGHAATSGLRASPTRTSCARSTPTRSTPDDFAGATVTLTNPGTLGTVQSVPRLMPGQGAIIGVGALGYPAEYQAADPRSLASLGVSPVVTLTSTYDHRIIQGAESGLFLTDVAESLTGEPRVLRGGVRRHGRPLRAGALAARREPGRRRPSAARQAGATSRASINMYRVRGHLIADLDPLSAEPAAAAPRARPRHLRPDAVGSRPRVRRRRAGRARRPDARRRSSTSSATPTAARSASSTCTSRTPSRSGGSSSTSRAFPPPSPTTSSATSWTA